ncbi:MAG TPA: hypothetical protein PLY97_05820 [Acidocella sp.]|nr:hypothetical protein [Acidocella sp.]
MYVLLFGLAAAINVVLGLHDWPGVLAGSLNDPDSYMRLLRIEQGIRAGHLLTHVARDDSGAGVMVEWSRLLDMLLWIMAAPMAVFLGWHKALFVAGVALGPLAVGALGAVSAWVVEPFVARRHLWTAALAAGVLPGVFSIALPGVVHYHVLLLVLIVATLGLLARAWPGAAGYGFLAGMCGGFAIWLTPETMPFILMGFAALLIRWWRARLGQVMTYCAAGFFDVLGFALVIDPPEGGYGVAEIDRLSLVYVVLALLLLIGSAALWRLEKQGGKWWRPAGLALMVGLVLGWVVAFPQVAMGPYGVMPPEERRKFLGVITEQQPLHGWDLLVFLAPGVMALGYALWRALAPRGRWLFLYLAACIGVALVLGAKFILFAGFSTCAAVVLLPLAVGEAGLRCADKPNLAALARAAVVLAVLGAPMLAAQAGAAAKPVGGGVVYPSCDLREIAPLLAPAGRQVVLATADDTPELLYRTQVETVGSLYMHGVPGFLRLRAAWRAVPGVRVPAAITAAGIRYVLFCPRAGRYLLVADLPPDTLWDALEANAPPPWVRRVGSNAEGWRLYKVTP